MSRRSTPLSYPPTRRQDLVETLHGVQVEDPYRWLEDSEDPEVRAWTDAQCALTRGHLDGLPIRSEVAARLRQLWNYPRVGLPTKRGGMYFFLRNDGLQNQAVLYVRDGRQAPPRTLLDPNALSEDGTAALTNLAISEDGRLLAYGISRSGSDWQEIRVRETATGADRDDRLQWVRFSAIAWTHDGTGFYYARYPAAGTVPEEEAHYHQKLYFHRLGEDQERDVLAYERPEDPLLGVSPTITEDGRHLIVHVFRGTGKDNEVFLRRVDRPADPFVALRAGFDASWQLLGSVGERLFFRTDLDAPRGSIVSLDAGRPEAPPRVLVSQGEEVIDFGAIVHGRLAVASLRDAHHRLRLYDLEGADRRDIELPGIGSITGLSGRAEDPEAFVGFTSFTRPQAVYEIDFGDQTLRPFHEPEVSFDPSRYVVRQVRYPSSDGTEIPMFLVHAEDLPVDGRRPVRLYGYGGFNISITPDFSPAGVVWLERGGVLAYPSLRGGAEFGEEWHAAGMLEHKQNVFDDFQAAARWLAESGLSSPERIAIQGGSNGGLLTGACLVQRPGLFGAVICQVPVLDMLRYHRWTIGRYWIPEYGSPEDPEQFHVLLAYSPYHNLRRAVFPAVLITTGDTDDRVHPAHARKFAARLQACSGGAAPALLRVETRAGHGAGKPTEKVLEEAADVLAFAFHALGVD